MRRRQRRWNPVFVAALAAIFVAALGTTVTDIGPWYQNLTKPSWQIPDAAFGVVWTIIFALAALSGAAGWKGAHETGKRQILISLFAFNGFLNVLWSLLFFTLKRPDYSLLEVPALWLSILVLIVFLWPISRRASVLLFPYLAWVSTAAALNYEVVRLNGPFD